MTTNEFSPLVCVLLQCNEARTALLESGLDLSRVQQQRRESRDAFWELIVAPLFNDATILFTLTFVVLVSADDEISTVDSKCAVSSPRTGS